MLLTFSWSVVRVLPWVSVRSPMYYLIWKESLAILATSHDSLLPCSEMYSFQQSLFFLGINFFEDCLLCSVLVGGGMLDDC